MSDQGQASGGTAALKSRPLEPEDLDAVVAIDREIVGRSRRGYFEKRLAAALRDPASHIQVAVADDDGLAGFVLARVLEGEYGRPKPAALLEAIGVSPARQHHGAGHMLMATLDEVMGEKGLGQLETQAAWNDHALLRFLDENGFALAPRQIVSCPVSRAAEL